MKHTHSRKHKLTHIYIHCSSKIQRFVLLKLAVHASLLWFKGLNITLRHRYLQYLTIFIITSLCFEKFWKRICTVTIAAGGEKNCHKVRTSMCDREICCWSKTQLICYERSKMSYYVLNCLRYQAFFSHKKLRHGSRGCHVRFCWRNEI